MTSSNPFSRVDPSADELELRGYFEAWMRLSVTDDRVHAGMLNTLSFLEHIGSVKIAGTQSGPAIDAEILQHLAEEARHADVLKRMMRRLVSDGFDAYHDDDLIAGPSARGYFARLDAVVRAFARDHFPRTERGSAAYNLVTWLIERRAMWLYPAYQEILESHGSRVSVRSIISEETRHLEDVVSALGRLTLPDTQLVVALVRLEEELFARLAKAMMAHA